MTEGTFRVNFTDVEVRNYDPIPLGKYLVAVTDFEIGTTSDSAKNPGQPLIQHEFTVQQPEMVGDMKVVERKLWTNFMPTIATTLFRLKGFLAALGDNAEGELDYDPAEICQRPFERRLVVVKVKIQPKRKDKEGKEYDERNEIRDFYPASTWGSVSTTVAPSNTGKSSLLP